MKIPFRFVGVSLAAATLASVGIPAIAHAATPPAVQLDNALKGRSAGSPVSCINQQSIRSSQIIDKTAILYKMNNGTIYVNRPVSGVSSLDNFKILATDTHSGQLCNVDIVHLLDQGSKMPAGSLGLGMFVPWTKD